MENNLHNTYLFKAIEAYPYELEKAVEALNYALSYDPENTKALHLMAKVHYEQLGDYETAKTYFERALAVRLDVPDLYPDYIRLLINNHDFDEAQKLIDYAKTVKGIDKAGIALTQGQLYESLMLFAEAEKVLKDAKHLALNNDFIFYVDDILSRIKKKKKIQENENRIIENQAKQEAETKPKTWFQNRLNNLL
ncbi:tetratricopeptide repeat protein [Winogradskyella jejuensis]|uniref:Tetratricopeptide repeat-containing protein n=1 Tax=Winogradskyella jejuensis TaxID=1089305 RepID=A0A1M5N6Y4_9FLAO|nr:tetratricopeptide repeat protein [Winogradskyella jejuensis]SHG84919.1 Tetratricopeptide repeat-containing protein [Winogradskyella jejuensis]